MATIGGCGARPRDGILVVEDDAEIREILVEMLEERGYRVTGAENGVVALQCLRDDGLRPCLILLDLMMPVMDGQAFRAAQRNHPELAGIPIVVISADHDLAAKVAGMAATAVLGKPIDVARLFGVVDALC